MSCENEKRFLILFSSYCLGNNATKKNVLDYIEQMGWIVFSKDDLEVRQNRNELIWRNDFAFVRKHLVMHGLLENKRNFWTITHKGRSELFNIYKQILRDKTIRKITQKALNDFLEFSSQEEIFEDIFEDKTGFLEGKIKTIQHITHERNNKLIELAKLKFKQSHKGKIYCEVCGFDFGCVYGKRGEYYIEAHHKKPISELNENTETNIEDIIMLCSNCHRMIHRNKPWLTIEELKNIVK